MTASVLTAAGYKTGLCTSPHLVRLSERFQIDGVEISDESLSTIAQQVVESSADICPTEFELMTAIAFCYFAQQECDMVVLEVGLGGRMDSTNVIAPPEVAVITAIGLDHVSFLGDNLPQIACEKAGILKSGSRGVLYTQTPEVNQVVTQICDDLNIPLTSTAPAETKILRCDLRGQQFSYRGERYEIALLGNHQVHNACTVLEIVAQLRSLGWNIPPDAVKTGLIAARWPGRLERISTSPDFLVDGGHNPQCLDALMTALKTLCPNQKFIFVMGILGDKDVDEMLNLTLPLAKQVIVITPDSPRALPAHQLAKLVEEWGVPAQWASSATEGAALARQLAEPEDVICAFGSLYTVGELRKGRNL